MTEGAVASVRAGPAAVDWDDWREMLRRFAAATGLCVAGYDDQRIRQAGHFLSSRVTTLMAAAGAWGDDRPAQRLETSLVARVLVSGGVERAEIGEELQVLASPIRLGGQTRGVVVYGWVFGSFSTALGCARVARDLGVDPIRLWAQARLEAPVAPSRMQVYSELLETMVDATSRHADALERLHALDRMREVFLAGVSHELRTPLSVISTRTEVLLRSALDNPEAIRASLQTIMRHVAEEARLVEDLIEASRTRTGQLTVSKQPASLNDIVRASVAAVMPHAEAKQVVLQSPPLDDGAREVVADAHRLQQVFWNLLSNAVKFTPAGGTVRLAVRSDADWHQVAVSDTGCGIEAALLPFVFEPFTKRQRSNEHGLGLGLAIARHIVELHGGTIAVRSDGPGTGSTFEVRLPNESGAVAAA